MCRDARGHAALDRLINQEVGRNILYAPACTQRGHFPLVRCEVAEKDEDIVPLVAHQLPVRPSEIVHFKVTAKTSLGTASCTNTVFASISNPARCNHGANRSGRQPPSSTGFNL